MNQAYGIELNELEIHLAKVNAQLDKVLAAVMAIRPGVSPNDEHLQNTEREIRAAKDANAQSLNRVSRIQGMLASTDKSDVKPGPVERESIPEHMTPGSENIPPTKLPDNDVPKELKDKRHAPAFRGK